MRGKGYALLIMLRATFIRCNAHPYVNFPFRVDDYISHSSRSIPRPLDIPYASHELTLREFFLTPARSIWFRHCIFVSCNIVSNSSRSLCTRLDEFTLAVHSPELAAIIFADNFAQKLHPKVKKIGKWTARFVRRLAPESQGTENLSSFCTPTTDDLTAIIVTSRFLGCLRIASSIFSLRRSRIEVRTHKPNGA
jgi:hypothetical protein